MSIILIILAAIVVLGPLVALHELGHYIVARWCGVKVLTYSIGFGPKLLSWTSKKTGINYAVSAIPLGGYVKMLDEREGEVTDSEKHLAFNNQKPWKKIAIVSAGPIMNFLIAFVLFWILFITPTQTLSTKIGSIVPSSPASQSTLQVGDEIIAIDNKSVSSWQEILYALADRMGETGTVSVKIHNQTGDITHHLPVEQFMKVEAGKTADGLTSLGVLPWQPTILPIVGEVLPEGVASRQGLQVGDVIKSVNGQVVKDWLSFSKIIRDNPENLLSVQVERAGKLIELELIPQVHKDAMGNRYGQIGAGVKQSEIHIPAEYQKTIVYDPVTAIAKSAEKTLDLSIMTLKSMGKMLTGLIGLDNISGPITIAKVANQSFSIGWQAVLSFMAMISLSLAVLNLLPIPVLDGGHIVYYTIEALRGKPLSDNVQMIGINIGLILLAGFMLLAISNDISRLF